MHTPSYKCVLVIFITLQVRCVVNSLKAESTVFARNYTIYSMDKAIEITPPKIFDNEIYLNRIECVRLDNASRCDVTQEISLYNDPTKSQLNRTCSFKIGDGSCKPNRFIKVVQLTKNRIIYDLVCSDRPELEIFLQLWIEEKVPGRRKLQIIDMENCQLIREVDFEVEKLVDVQANFLSRPSSNERFDIFYTNSTLCEDGRMRMGFDKDGNPLEGPLCEINGVEYTSRRTATKVQIFSDVAGQHLVLERNKWWWNVCLVNYTDNTETALISEWNKKQKLDIKIAANNERLVSCTRFEKNVNCSFMDIRNTEFKDDVSLNFPYEVLEFELYNLANGDFLILTEQEDDQLFPDSFFDDDDNDKDKDGKNDDDDENDDDQFIVYSVTNGHDNTSSEYKSNGDKGTKSPISTVEDDRGKEDQKIQMRYTVQKEVGNVEKLRNTQNNAEREGRKNDNKARSIPDLGKFKDFSDEERKRLAMIGALNYAKKILTSTREKDVLAMYELRRYRRDGTLVGNPIELEGWSCQGVPRSRSQLSFVEVDRNHICINFKCKTSVYTDYKEMKLSFKFITRCIDLEDVDDNTIRPIPPSDVE